MNRRIECVSPEEGARIDLFLAGEGEGLTRSMVQRSLEKGLVTVNGVAVAKNYRLRRGDRIEATIEEAEPLRAEPQDIPVEIVYEDEALLIVNKPKGMVVHPAPGNPDGTLVNALLFHSGGNLSRVGDEFRPGIVHRIDKDTSGLLIVAKTSAAHLNLAEQIASHSFHRVYEAVVHGRVREDSFTIEKPIGRHPIDRKKMAVTAKNSRPAVTHCQVVERYAGFTHMRLALETGRTHQIRVHLASIGHPVAGDPMYGPKKGATGLAGQCLHAREIGFVHPVTGENLHFDSPLPDYFVKFLAKVAKVSQDK